MNSRQEVDKLLVMYSQYKALNAELNQVQGQLARAKIRRQSADELKQHYEVLQAELQTVSDSMTFDTPLIWTIYKYEAYADEAQPITTLHDFRQHCSKPGYICTKRFQFVNKALQEANEPQLIDVVTYPDDNKLPSIYGVLSQLEDNDQFMSAWREREYYRLDGRVAKWENE